jgi:MFS superfamily sulfate permease-like transporter
MGAVQKVAIITGASRGIGAALIKAYRDRSCRTQLTNLVAAVLCFLSLVLLTPLFRGMPHPALAAIMIATMLHLSKPGYLRDLIARSRWEFAIAAVVIVAELTLGVLHGIAIGVAFSLLLLIYLL